MNIALITYQISPYKGSEFNIAWNHLMQIAKNNKVCVFYSSRIWGEYNNDIKRFCRENALNNVNFIDCHENSIFYELLNKFRKISPRTLEKFFGSVILSMDKKSISKKIKCLNNIDCVHFLNPMGFLTLSFDYKIASIPCIWGPIQAAEPGEWFLIKNLLFKHKKLHFFIDYIVRKTIHVWLFRHSSNLRSMLKNCCKVFASTPHSKTMLLKYHKIEAEFLPENCISALEREIPIRLDKNEPLKIIFCGGLDTRKNVYLLLDALAKITNCNWILTVVGSGQEADFNKLVIKYGYSEKVKWLGYVNRNELQKIFMQQHLLSITSVREASTTVLWEAMAKLIPILTLDMCGMGGILTNNDSIKIDISSRNYEIICEQIAQEIKNLTENPERIKILSLGMLEAAKIYSSEQRILFWNNIYTQLLQKL